MSIPEFTIGHAIEAGKLAVRAAGMVGDIVPVPFLGQALSIVSSILARAEQAEHNKSTCIRLSARCRIATDTLQRMPRENLADNPAMEAYVKVLQDIEAFIDKAANINKFMRWLNAAEVKSSYDGLAGRLDICIADLGLIRPAFRQQGVDDASRSEYVGPYESTG